MGTSDFSFHEATVVGFARVDARIDLVLDDVLLGGFAHRVAVSVFDVASVAVDGRACDDHLMAAPDGEVLTLNVLDDGFDLIVEWNVFPTRQSFVRSYRLRGGRVSISLLDGGGSETGVRVQFRNGSS